MKRLYPFCKGISVFKHPENRKSEDKQKNLLLLIKTGTKHISIIYRKILRNFFQRVFDEILEEPQ